MATPGAAYGMFTFKRSGQGKVLPLGSGAEIEDYYLNLWQGRFLVTLTGFDASAKTIEGLKALAAAVAGKMSESAPVPALVAALPSEGLRPQSVKYLKGLLGLNNVYPFYTGRGLDFAEAVKGDYVAGMLIVLEYGSAGASREALVELGRSLAASERFKKPDGNNLQMDTLRLIDDKGRYLGFSVWGTQLLLAIAVNPPAVNDLLRQVRKL